MCYAAHSVELATQNCSMCRIMEKVYRRPNTSCPHREAMATCKNWSNHPNRDIVYFRNAELNIFNGCGFCRWAEKQPPGNPYNQGTPGCCRPPRQDEIDLIDLRDWPGVSYKFTIPLPPHVREEFQRLMRQASNSNRSEPPPSSTTRPPPDPEGPGGSTTGPGTNEPRRGAEDPRIRQFEANPPPGPASRSSAAQPLQRPVSYSQAEAYRDPRVPDPRSAGPYEVDGGMRSRFAVPPSANIPPMRRPADSSGTSRRPSIPQPESTPSVRDAPTLRRPVENKPSHSRGPTLDLAAAFEQMRLTPQRDNRESVTSVTTVTSEGFTDYISDDSEDELQRQTQLRAEIAHKARVEEAEFQAARRGLEAVDLQSLDEPRYPPPPGPPPPPQLTQRRTEPPRRPDWETTTSSRPTQGRHGSVPSTELIPRPTESRVQPSSAPRNVYPDFQSQPAPPLSRSNTLTGDSTRPNTYQQQPVSSGSSRSGRRETQPNPATEAYNNLASYRGQQQLSQQSRSQDGSWSYEGSRPGQPVSEVLQFPREQSSDQPSRSPRPPPRPEQYSRSDAHQPDSSRPSDPYNGPRRGYPPYDRP